MELGMKRRLDLPFDEAVERTRAVLKDEGFGILTEIDVSATLEEKLGAAFRRYVILGACNPPLAHRALTETLDVGLLLPCNVIVYEEGAGSIVAAMDPGLLAEMFEGNVIDGVASEAREKLGRALDALAR